MPSNGASAQFKGQFISAITSARTNGIYLLHLFSSKIKVCSVELFKLRRSSFDFGWQINRSTNIEWLYVYCFALRTLSHVRTDRVRQVFVCSVSACFALNPSVWLRSALGWIEHSRKIYFYAALIQQICVCHRTHQKWSLSKVCRALFAAQQLYGSMLYRNCIFWVVCIYGGTVTPTVSAPTSWNQNKYKEISAEPQRVAPLYEEVGRNAVSFNGFHRLATKMFACGNGKIGAQGCRWGNRRRSNHRNLQLSIEYILPGNDSHECIAFRLFISSFSLKCRAEFFFHKKCDTRSIVIDTCRTGFRSTQTSEEEWTGAHSWTAYSS